MTTRPSSLGHDANSLKCIPCLRKGHTCYASQVDRDDGEAKCVYCLDSEPCFYEQREKSKPQVSGAHTASVSASLPPRGAPEKSRNVPVASPGKPAARPRGKQRASSAPPALGKAAEEVIGMHSKLAGRVCKCGCGETVPKSNRFSFINGHRSRSPRAGKADNGKQRGRPAKKLAAPATTAPAFTLRVSEAQLDRYVLGLSGYEWVTVVKLMPVTLKLDLANFVLDIESAVGAEPKPAASVGAAA